MDDEREYGYKNIVILLPKNENKGLIKYIYYSYLILKNMRKS